MLQYLAVQGVAGGVWFAAGAVIQIFFFGIVAVEIKRRAPTAHTVLEIVAIRWGNKARVETSKTNRRTDGQTDRRTDRQTDKQTDRLTDPLLFGSRDSKS
ncbi:TPA: urea active transporter [Trebouxia sp. C0006]